MTTNEQTGRPPGSAVTPCVLLSPHEAHGAGDWQTSWWCPGVSAPSGPTPEELQQQHRDRQYAEAGLPPVGEMAYRMLDQMLAELEAEPVVTLTTQEELLTALDALLDSAVHSDECYVNPDDTVCFCLIGRVRDQLPVCGAIQLRSVPTRLAWTCTRTAHPASPDRHVFEAI